MNKRCGLPLALPLHAKKLCPGLSHAAGPGIVSGMGNGKKRGLSCRSTGAMGAGISRRCREIPADGKRQKSGHDPDGHVRFFDGSIASAEGPPRTAGLPRLQRRDAAGGTGRAFSGPSARACAAFSGRHPCMGLFLEKEDREGHRPAGSHRIPALRPHPSRRRGGAVAARETPGTGSGATPPCPAIFFQISLSGMPQARATPAP